MTVAENVRIELRVPPSLSSIIYARMVLRRTMPTGTPDDEALYLGAVTEVLANAIHAHRRDGITEPVKVTIDLAGRRAGVSVVDAGSGFDPQNPRMRPFGGGSGLGLRIVRSVCADIAIESGPRGTTVALPFPRSWRHEASGPDSDRVRGMPGR